MPRIQHNGEGFHYIVGYRPYDQRGGETIEIRVNDYEADKYVIDGMETFKEFEVYVQAANNEGKSHQRPTHRKGYSGEDSKSKYHCISNFLQLSLYSLSCDL